MAHFPDIPHKGTNLEPIPYWSNIPQDKRSQLQLFMNSNVPEVDEVQAVVDETLKVYPFVQDNPDFARVIGFAAWRALVNRERAVQAVAQADLSAVDSGQADDERIRLPGWPGLRFKDQAEVEQFTEGFGDNMAKVDQLYKQDGVY